MTYKRNGEIEFFRIIFCIAVVLTHFNSYFKLGLFNRGTFGVEFFFLVSGYFMARSAEKIADDNYTQNTIVFIKNKMLTFMPYYIGAVIVHFVVLRVFIEHRSLWDLGVHIVKLIPESVFLQMGGFATESWVNVPAVWYLSAMLLSMLVLFPLTIKFKKSYGIIFLVFAIFGLGYIVRQHGGYLVAFRTNDMGFFYDGMLRALCEVGLGASFYQICGFITENASKENEINKQKKVLLTILKYCGYIAVSAFVFSSINNKYEPIALVVLSICFILTNSGYTYNIPYNSVIGWLGRFTLPLYLFHSVVFRCMTVAFGVDKSLWYIALVLGMAIIGSVLFMIAVDFICKKRSLILLSFGTVVVCVVVSYVMYFSSLPKAVVDSSLLVNERISSVHYRSDTILGEDFYISEDSKLEKIEFHTITWHKQFEDDQTLQIVIRDKQSEELLYTETLNMSEFTDARAYSLEPEIAVKLSAKKWYTIEYIAKTSEGQQYMAMMLTDVSNNTEGTTYINGEIVEGHIAMKLWTKG